MSSHAHGSQHLAAGTITGVQKQEAADRMVTSRGNRRDSHNWTSTQAASKLTGRAPSNADESGFSGG